MLNRHMLNIFFFIVQFFRLGLLIFIYWESFFISFELIGNNSFSNTFLSRKKTYFCISVGNERYCFCQLYYVEYK